MYIWSASSRVGVSTSMRGVAGVRGRSVSLRSWRAGSTKPAVLPVPVWAEAMTSRPAMTSGIAFS